MNNRRQRLFALAQLVGTAAAMGAFDDAKPPAVVPVDPEHPGPVGEHCCWANYMVSPATHNEDCGNAPTDGAKGGA